MKLNIFFRLEKAWFGARQKLVSSLNYEFCYEENLILQIWPCMNTFQSLQIWLSVHTISHPTDPVSMILASNFTEEIKNPHIKNKLRSYKISNLQDIFKFALEEDQKQKIRALDFEVKPDTIAHCDI